MRKSWPVTLDEAIRLSIHELFPESEVPDEVNFDQDGNQYPAVDHYIPDLHTGIERKSISSAPRSDPRTGDDRYYVDALSDISERQGGSRFKIYGTIHSETIFKKMPYPNHARMSLHNRVTNSAHKHFKDSLRKFDTLPSGANPPVRITIMSDQGNSEIPIDNFANRLGALAEKFEKDREKSYFVTYIRWNNVRVGLPISWTGFSPQATELQKQIAFFVMSLIFARVTERNW